MNPSKTVDISGGVLVGHDGSRFSDQALEWALAYAEKFSLPVTVVRAWVITTAPTPKSKEFGYVPPLSDFADATCDALKSDIARFASHHPDVAVSCQAVHGSASGALVEGSGGADLLVVGPRGVGGFKGLMLGSVSTKLVSHAQCPTVVVRGGTDDPTPAAAFVLDENLESSADTR